MNKEIDSYVIEQARKRFHYDKDSGKFYRMRGRSRKRVISEEITSENHGYVILSLCSTKFMAHRIAWSLINGPIPSDLYIDHKDGNKKNNCISNLRLANKKQNAWNVGTPAANKSGVKGVHFDSHTGMWRASCGKKKIGRFVTIEEAAIAVCRYREMSHGEFSNHGVIS